MTDSFTGNYNLTKPADGDTNWGAAKMNPNLDSIDAQLKNRESEIAGHINKGSGAHGIDTSSLFVGTQETQTLFSKTFGNTTTFNGGGAFNAGASFQTAGTVSLLGIDLNGFTGANITLTGGGIFSGIGSGLTNLGAAQLTGTIADARLSSNVALLNTAINTFSGATFAGRTTLNNDTLLQGGVYFKTRYISGVDGNPVNLDTTDYYVLMDNSGVTVKLPDVSTMTEGRTVIVTNIAAMPFSKVQVTNIGSEFIFHKNNYSSSAVFGPGSSSHFIYTIKGGFSTWFEV